MNIAVAVSTEYKVTEISPEFSKLKMMIRLVLNLALSPKHNSREYLVPSNLRKRRNEAIIFEFLETAQISRINNGLTSREAIDTEAPTLRRNSGERKMYPRISTARSF